MSGDPRPRLPLTAQERATNGRNAAASNHNLNQALYQTRQILTGLDGDTVQTMAMAAVSLLDAEETMTRLVLCSILAAALVRLVREEEHPDARPERLEATPMTDDAAQWRLIETDTESPSGVAPVCDKPDQHADWATRSWSTHDQAGATVDGPDVWDCCPGPHIECWTPRAAEQVLVALTTTGAEICT